jgi:PAS domain S-box-containing protein
MTDRTIEPSAHADIPSYEKMENILEGQSDILDMISQAKPLPIILNAIINWVEKNGNGDLLASILLVDDEGKRLLHGAAPSLPQEYNDIVHGIEIGPTVGSCGAAAYSRLSVIVEDIATDPLWDKYKAIPLAHGLRACWSFPLISKQGRVLGTYAIYYKFPHRPSDKDLQLIQLVSRTATLAIEYHQVEKEKSALLEREKQSIEEGRQERKKFYQLLMNAPAMIAVLHGPEHVFELANDIYQQAVGIGRPLLGLPVAKALPEVVEPGFINLLDSVYNTGKPFFGDEVPLKLDRKKNGELEDRFFNFVYQPITNEHSQVEGVFVHAVDITDQVLARKRAEASEERFRSFVLNAPTPIGIYVGREMRIQTVNDAILAAWDKDYSVVGKTFREALPELEGQPFFQLLDDVYTTGIPYQATEDRVDLVRNGKKVITYYNFTYSPLKNENGEIYGVMNTATEVTDLVLARKKLVEAQENLQSAIEVAELGTWTLHLDAQKVSYSWRMAEWFGVQGSEASLDEMFNSIHPDDRSRVKAVIENTLATRQPYEVEHRVINQLTGVERIIHVRGQLSFHNDEPVSLNGTARDVTIQKMTEKELERQVELRTVELQKANIDLHHVNENLKQFAYIASHDLQEPLRKINVYSDILLNSDKEHLSPSGKSYLNKMSKATKRMSALIKDLLEFSKVNIDERAFTEVNLNEILSSIKVDFEVLINQKQAKVFIEPLCTVQAIPLQMNQLFYNLVGNALKFTATGAIPEIKVSSRLLSKEEVLVHHELNSRWQHCEITVKDNGIGFNKQYAQQIFEIFQRLHTKEDYEGTGIGLALCKKIVTNHDGIIIAHSQEGEGAEFRVILPISR